jgi:hypothetical protein
MVNKLANVRGGEFFAIPLFLSDRSELERFKKADFLGETKKFAYCRIIKDLGGGGIIVEVFNLINGLSPRIEDIIQSGRLFRPIAVSGLGIYKKRWVKIGQQEHYDEEKDSQFSQIQLVLPALPQESPRLWQNGQEKFISFEESNDYEGWTIWLSSHLEKRIIDILNTRGIEI